MKHKLCIFSDSTPPNENIFVRACPNYSTTLA